MSLVLVACGNEEEPEATTENEDSEEVARLKEENEELKRQQAEEKQQEDEDPEEQSVENEETSKDEESSTDSEETEQVSTDRSSLVFDINSPEVQSQLIGTNNGNTEGNFKQDVITVGMSQTEVEEMYGPYDFTFYYQGSSPAFYGNLAVVYSELGPHGNGSDGSLSDVNPDNNIVDSIYYYADITEDELIDAFGEPTEQDDGSKSMNGLPFYIYEGETDDGKFYMTTANTFNTPEGERIGLIMRSVFDEDPNSAHENSNASSEGLYFEKFAHTEGFPVTITNEKDNVDDYYIYDTLTNFTNDYIAYLVSYFNDESDDVINYVTGNALNKINANKASGNFSYHKNYYTTMISIIQTDIDQYEVTLDRTYSHATSDGQQTTQVTYTVLDTSDGLQVIDFN